MDRELAQAQGVGAQHSPRSFPKPSLRVIAAVGVGTVTATMVAAIYLSLSRSPPGKQGEVQTTTTTTPGGTYDLDSCKDKSTWRVTRCTAGSAVACWSTSDVVAWSCWSEKEVPTWALSQIEADVQCKAMAKGGPFAGACTLLTPAMSPGAPVPLAASPGSWDDAYAKAKGTLLQMTHGEKKSLLRGIGWNGMGLQKWWYVGNTAAIPRLNIPSLNMQDAAGGFRTYWDELVGTVTAWPSLLSLAAMWNPDAVQAFAVALGKEFAGKGANGILGPSVDVYRVARGGRNFEFLSGEDPYLGAKLAKAYVQGVQSQGVFCVMKHWVFDSQETNRNTESSVVDDKTAWELYYPPFEAAVEAGVSAAMCSYNRVDGVYACENDKQLNQILKQRMGFRGFVQSDWWATHDTSLGKGLDQEMPSTNKATFFSDSGLATQPAQAIDAAATRILAVIHRMNLTTAKGCIPPACRDMFLRNVAPPRHRALARTLAMHGIVMLKNKDNVLPLAKKRVRTIAVIGQAASAPVYNPNGANQGGDGWSYGDYYAGGGSGHVVAGNAVTPLAGLAARAKQDGIRVIEPATSDQTAAVNAARKADVTIIVAGTTSGESKDRPNLNLDHGADGLIKAVAKESVRTVVLVEASGPVLMPWRDHVAGALILFLGGQETGAAWADVLFGDHAPTGRLPVSIPHSEADAIEPSSAPEVVYSESMQTGYRNTAFTFAYHFGHGLTYTTFKYLTPEGGPCKDTSDNAILCIKQVIKNTGKRATRTVAQLYLQLLDAGHPAPLLRGFRRTGVILPGGVVTADFRLTSRDLSYYDADAGQWVEASAGSCHIGESSADIRQELPISKGAKGIWTIGRSKEVAIQKPQKEPAVILPKPHTPALRPGPRDRVVAGSSNDLGAGTDKIERCSSSSLKEDCRETKCCSEPGMQCYQKNPWWGTCRASCQVDSINPLEEKKYQTAWDCVPLGPRSPASIPTAPPVFKAPKESEPAPGDKKNEEVVIHMKANQIPVEWIEGSTVTVLGGNGKPVHAQIVSMTIPTSAEQSGDADAQSSQQAHQGQQDHGSQSGTSPVLWIVAVLLGILLGIPGLVLLVLIGYWTAYIRNSEPRMSCSEWLRICMINAGKAVSTYSSGLFSSAMDALHRATEQWQGPVPSTQSQGPADEQLIPAPAK